MSTQSEQADQIPLQQTFDAVVEHLATQGKKSLILEPQTGQAQCAYRGAGGTKCSVGILISDDDYVEEMEGLSANSELIFDFAYASNQESLVNLQFVHDTGHLSEWGLKLEALAKTENLIFNRRKFEKTLAESIARNEARDAAL